VNIIITGASDGIGLHIAVLLNQPDISLLLVAKRPKANFQHDLANQQRYISASLDSPAGINRVVQEVNDLGWDTIDLLIHNAGVGWVGESKEQPWHSINELLSLNCTAPIALTHKLLPHLLKANGKLVFIGSSATHKRCPSFSVYAASKATIAGFVRSLRIELQQQLTVQLIHPGPTKTSMHAKAGLKKHWIQTLFRQPQSVATEILWAIESNRKTVKLGSIRYRLYRIGRALKRSTHSSSTAVSSSSINSESKTTI